MNIWIYDIETYPNCFQIVFYNIKTFKWKVFEISDRLNEEEKLKEFLKSGISLIGFNNINFDYPLLHHTLLKNKTNTAQEIFEVAETIINSKYSAIWDNQVKIPQLDLYKIWHYDNKNKATS